MLSNVGTAICRLSWMSKGMCISDGFENCMALAPINQTTALKLHMFVSVMCDHLESSHFWPIFYRF